AVPKPAGPGGERGSPDSTGSPGSHEALEDLPASGVDNEALVTGRADADVGEINPWPAHKRRNQPEPFPLQAPFDLAGRCGPPRRQPLGRRGGNEGESNEGAERRTR